MSKTIVIPDLVHILPFRRALTWEKFQLFCTDVLYKTFNSIDSREYLLKGSSQQGIDVYAIKKGEQKRTVAQCKLVDYLGPKQVLDIVDEFLNGDLADNTNEFILCTSADLARQNDEEKTIAESRQKLAAKNIELIIWDERGLSKELRTNSTEEIINIVYRYFGEQVASAFYGDIWKQYIKKLQSAKKRPYPVAQDYIERTIISYNDQVTNKSKTAWNYWYNESKDTLMDLLSKPIELFGKKIVLLSTAGFGKTEELKNVAGFYSTEDKIIYPVKFSLRDYEGQTIEAILSNYDLSWKNIPEENILLLFDGLDEITEHYFQPFINNLNAFIEQNQLVQVVVSSRYNFYDVRYPALRGFEIFLLHPLNNNDIEKYLEGKLGDQKGEFINILQQHGFYEYIQNPYYLTRLVRFFNKPDITFPKNKTELFDRILFEQLEKDETTYNINELKDKLLPFARQVAFCMTLSGKSILIDEEIKSIIPEQEIRTLLNRFSIFNRNATAAGVWSFEHKNLQEYLSASVFSDLSFDQIHNIISFKLDNKKLLPRFLNTVSFLFELISKDSPLFHDLFSWINTNEPELLIRFEKDQLSKQTRNNIFFKIFAYYKSKEITLRVSSNFSLQELAWFIEIDNDIVDFLSKEMELGISPQLVYDVLSIIGYCERPFVMREKIESILFEVLKNNNYPDFIIAKAITTFVSTGFMEQSVFDKILISDIDLNNAEIRRGCIHFLDFTNYYEYYSSFILETITVLEDEQKKNNLSISFFTLKRLILKFTAPQKIKEIFQYSISDRDLIRRHSHAKEFQFDFGEIKTLLEKATEVYKTDTSILPVIYRLFCDMEYVTQDKEWFAPFRSFFELTCGTSTIFHKFYKFGKKERDIMAFADRNCCDFLISEYKSGEIEDKQMTFYRNFLSYIDRDIFLYFYDQLKELGNGVFIIEDIDVDYNEIRLNQERNNQELLLDRDLFIKEADTIFSIIAKDNITTEDFWYSENVELRKYQNSLVLETIRNMCIYDDDKIITREDFLNKYNDSAEWQGFVIETIHSLLENKNIPSVDQRLLDIAAQWCKNKIETLDFENSIIDHGENFQYSHIVEFVKSLFLLLDIDLEDGLLLKMLPSDYQSYYGLSEESEKSISVAIIRKVKNKDVLRSAVINNIKSNKLASFVLCSHFAVSHKLGYRECLPFLFNAIVNNKLLSDHNRMKLVEYYFDLGGEKADFKNYLKIPEIKTENDLYSSFEWFLIEKLLFVEPVKITELLLEILKDAGGQLNKLPAAKNLIKLSRIEGLLYVEIYIKETGIIPFEHHWSELQEFIAKLPAEKAAEIFCSILEHFYLTNYHDKYRGEQGIAESCFESLGTLSYKKHDLYIIIKTKLDKMIQDFREKPFVSSLVYYTELFTRRYYESQLQEVDINAANLIFKSLP